jgi:iron-sulfur cluster assembly accessory protein
MNMITVTEAAVLHLQSLVSENPEYKNKGLRIFVEQGGCAGHQYGMKFDEAKASDFRFERDGVNVLIDPQSAQFLQGSQVDYQDGLTGAGFQIINPNAARSCGCGSSFEVAEKSP